MTNLNIVDFHTHILPNADHGSSSVEVSIQQLRYAMNAGVNRIVATPHFYPNSHTVSDFLRRREGAFSRLSKHQTVDMPDIVLGAEVLLCENLHKLEGLSNLTVANTNIILLELPYHSIDQSHVQTVASIMELGYDIVLAHGDKYKKEDIEKFVELGAKIQLNATAITSVFHNRHLFEWIDRGLVVALGSDIHGRDRCAYKAFAKAKQKLKASALFIKEKSDEIWNKTK